MKNLSRTEKGRQSSSRLLTLPVLASAQEIAAPALIVVGDVVRMHPSLGWFAPAAAQSPCEEPALR